MAENVTLAPIVSFVNDASAAATYNSNNGIVTTALADCLSISGTQPNAMQSNLDMNQFQIINLPAPSTANSPVRLTDVANGIQGPIGPTGPTGPAGTPAVVFNTDRVPNATDDSSKGYVVGNLWVMKNGDIWTCRRTTINNANWQKTNASQGFLLDILPTASAAYSVVKLRSAYAGNCFQVTRASDSTTLDIGFVNNIADFASADSFCTGTTGTITKLYDQSGNTRDATAGVNPFVMSFNSVNGFRSWSNQNGGSIFGSFNLPVGVAVTRNACSVVMAHYCVAPAQGSTAYWTLGSDGTFTNDLILTSSNLNSFQALGNVFPVATPKVQAIPQVLISSSGVSNFNITQNEETIALAPMSSISLTGGQIGSFTGYEYFGDILAFVVYGRALSTTETTIAKQWAYRTFKFGVQVTDRLIGFGDSIMAGADCTPSLNWLRQSLDEFVVRPYRIYNSGSSGQTATFFATNWVSNGYANTINNGTTRNVVIFHLGTNDIEILQTNNQIYTNLTTLVANAKAAGAYKVIVATVLPRQNTAIPGGAAAFETLRLALNTTIRANAAGADYILDIGADATIGTFASSADSTLYVGDLHPTPLGASYIASDLIPILNLIG